MKIVLNNNRPDNSNKAYMPNNDLLVDRSGFVPTHIQVDRIFKTSEIAAMYQRLKNPNGSEERIVEDLTQLEANYKDDLQMLATCKTLRSSLDAKIEASKASSSLVTNNVTAESVAVDKTATNVASELQH